MKRVLAMLLLALALLLGGVTTGQAAGLHDAGGRLVAVPDMPARLLPAGPPAAVLLQALAPDLLLGWPHGLPGAAAAWLPARPQPLPALPMLTARATPPDLAAQIAVLHPALILDYGTVSPRYVALDQDLQTRLGVPTLLLDGRLRQSPDNLRQLGAVLHRQARAEQLAQLAETVLAAVPPPRRPAPRVIYAKGEDGLDLGAPGNGATEIFALLGWQVLAPPGAGRFHPATLAQIVQLDPDIIIFQDAAMRQTVAASPAWRRLRAVAAGHAYIAPGLPFGWVEEPPSLNRLLGLAWLSQPDGDVATRVAALAAVLFGRAPDATQLAQWRDTLRPIAP